MNELAQYNRQLWIKPRLKYVFFELTDKCNLNCVHCGSRSESKNNNYLSAPVIEKTLYDISTGYDPSQILVCLTGGEPFLHPNLFGIIKNAVRMGFPVGMTTNGTLIDEEKARRVFLSGINTISVSIDGLEAEHDNFRQVKGCFHKAIRGIINLKRNGLEPEVITVVHKGNIGKIDEVYRLICDMDIYAWRLVSVDPMGRAGEKADILLDSRELLKLLDYVRNKRNDKNCKMLINYGCSHFLSYEYENEVRDYYFQCTAGTQTAGIRANGDMVACLDIEPIPLLIQGNIYRDDFVEVWEKKYRAFRYDRTEDSDVCKNCKDRSICLGDSMHTWDFLNKKPKYCVSKMIASNEL